MDLCVTHMGFLVGTHPRANPELPSVHREESGLTGHLPVMSPQHTEISRLFTHDQHQQINQHSYSTICWVSWCIFGFRDSCDLNKNKYSSTQGIFI